MATAGDGRAAKLGARSCPAYGPCGLLSLQISRHGCRSGAKPPTHRYAPEVLSGTWARAMLSGVILLCLHGVVGCSSDEPVAAPAVTVTATVTASPAAPFEISPGHQLNTPTAKATASRSPTSARRPSAQQGGSSVAFKHFKVTVRQMEQAPPGVRVLAEVCVRRLPPDPQGNRTRISWDPWSIVTGSKTVDAGLSSTSLPGAFPADRTYRVGQCAAGWIPFPAKTRPLKISYVNGVGDRAVWDARDLTAPPRTGAGRPGCGNGSRAGQRGRQASQELCQLRCTYG